MAPSVQDGRYAGMQGLPAVRQEPWRPSLMPNRNIERFFRSLGHFGGPAGTARTMPTMVAIYSDGPYGGFRLVQGACQQPPGYRPQIFSPSYDLGGCVLGRAQKTRLNRGFVLAPRLVHALRGACSFQINHTEIKENNNKSKWLAGGGTHQVCANLRTFLVRKFTFANYFKRLDAIRRVIGEVCGTQQCANLRKPQTCNRRTQISLNIKADAKAGRVICRLSASRRALSSRR